MPLVHGYKCIYDTCTGKKYDLVTKYYYFGSIVLEHGYFGIEVPLESVYAYSHCAVSVCTGNLSKEHGLYIYPWFFSTESSQKPLCAYRFFHNDQVQYREWDASYIVPLVSTGLYMTWVCTSDVTDTAVIPGPFYFTVSYYKDI